MREIKIIYDNSDGNLIMMMEDTDGQTVDVELNEKDQKAYITSLLHGDEVPVYGSCHIDDGEIAGLALMGVPYRG